MREDRQLTFSRKWWQRGQAEEDPFDRFFCLWIALVVSAQRYATYHGEARWDATDADRVRLYFSGMQSGVLAALSRHDASLRRLSQRRGTLYGNPIVDTGNPELKSKFKAFAEHFSGGTKLPPALLVEYTAELVNKVRNNLFHGLKIYDDREDLQVLELLTPLLSDILARTAEFGEEFPLRVR